MGKKLTNIYNRTKRELGKHLTDSTAMLVYATPTYAIAEMLAGMTPGESENARILGAKWTYFGMGKAYAGGMELSRKLFGADKDITKLKKHDTFYGVAYSAVISPVFYLCCGTHDIKKIAFGTAFSVGVGLVSGWPTGLAIDSYRDFTGLEDSDRLHPSLQNKSRAFKVGLAGILAATSIAATDGIYGIRNFLGKQFDSYGSKQTSAEVTK
jgi:hypothetical protein